MRPAHGSGSASPVAEEPKEFEFNAPFWSCDKEDLRGAPRFVRQQHLYDEIGVGLLEDGLQGFNVTTLAYGQTGAGKSYSVLGSFEDLAQRGLLPRTVEGLFVRAAALLAAEPRNRFECEVSYLEIYNDEIRDLLRPPEGFGQKPARGEVRELKEEGVVVVSLTTSRVAFRVRHRRAGAATKPAAATTTLWIVLI